MIVDHPLLSSYKSVLNLSMPILLQAVIWISVSSKIHLVAASTDYRMICTSPCKSFIFVLRFDDSCSRFLFWGTPCKRVCMVLLFEAFALLIIMSCCLQTGMVFALCLHNPYFCPIGILHFNNCIPCARRYLCH